MQPVIERLVHHLDRVDPGKVRGFYLFGSAVTGGLRPDSDMDLLLVTERSLAEEERAQLLGLLLRFSGRRATAVPGRPLELTSVVRGDVVPWTYPPRCDFLYGEWLRDEFEHGDLPAPHVNPDLAVLLTTVVQHAQILRGPRPADLLSPVPVADLQRSLQDSLGSLLNDLIGDERNVLLTLARMLVTLGTGEIVSKDEAAVRIMPTLTEPDRAVMALAAAAYLGSYEDDWTKDQGRARSAAMHLAARIVAQQSQ